MKKCVVYAPIDINQMSAITNFNLWRDMKGFRNGDTTPVYLAIKRKNRNVLYRCSGWNVLKRVNSFTKDCIEQTVEQPFSRKPMNIYLSSLGTASAERSKSGTAMFLIK